MISMQKISLLHEHDIDYLAKSYCPEVAGKKRCHHILCCRDFPITA